MAEDTCGDCGCGAGEHHAGCPALTDLQFTNMGFAVSCMPLTDLGHIWLAENVPAAAAGLPLLIEPRYLEDIVEGARMAGLVCTG